MQEFKSAKFVSPHELLPEVTNGIMILPLKSYFSKKEFITTEALYH
ncbi:hypothetical protein O6B34_02070 [Campylobacter ureolyticus]|nr:hypothetical protein [Campylobacter ureolyticus]MCZ6104867.1 hypothetical protein [Campylobacter ureolyticus]MCZ6157482.1 hypothetical protein [Campylobacter ureolyticus]